MTASVKPQDCRDLLKCISDMEDTVGAEVGLVDGADKENMCAGMVTPVRPSGKAAVCPGSSHSGVHMKDASGGLRQYLKEQSVGKAEARRISGAYMGLACASPDASLARGVVMVVGSSGALSARGGPGSSCGRPRNSLGGNGSVTPLLVLQRTSSTPAMPLRSRLSLSGNNVPGPFPLSMADEGCGEKTALAGSCTPTLSAPAGGFMDGSCSELGSARDPIILPIGEEAAALLETWPAGYRSMEVS